MGDVIPLKKALTFEQEAEQTIRRLAENSGLVYISSHALKRMRQRGVTRPQVFECLKKGAIKEALSQDASGSWIGKFSKLVAGQGIDVVAKLQEKDDGELVLVITVITP